MSRPWRSTASASSGSISCGRTIVREKEPQESSRKKKFSSTTCFDSLRLPEMVIDSREMLKSKSYGFTPATIAWMTISLGVWCI